MFPLPPFSTLFPYTDALPISMAFTFGLTRSICFRCSSSASRAESFLVWIKCPISTALIKQIEGVLDCASGVPSKRSRSEEHTSELQSRRDLVCRLLLEKKKWQ